MSDEWSTALAEGNSAEAAITEPRSVSDDQRRLWQLGEIRDAESQVIDFATLSPWRTA